MQLEPGELPKKARERLPPRAQHMFLETMRRAILAASTKAEAEKMAWEAVRRKYGPRPTMKLWVRHDWRRTASRRPGDTTAASSNQRRLATVERERKRERTTKTARAKRRPSIRAPKRRRVTVSATGGGKGPARAKRIGRERTLGESPRVRKGIPQRRPVGRRA
jgi:cation transport regulator ChaB